MATYYSPGDSPNMIFPPTDVYGDRIEFDSLCRVLEWNYSVYGDSLCIVITKAKLRVNEIAAEAGYTRKIKEDATT